MTFYDSLYLIILRFHSTASIHTHLLVLFLESPLVFPRIIAFTRGSLKDLLHCMHADTHTQGKILDCMHASSCCCYYYYYPNASSVTLVDPTEKPRYKVGLRDSSACLEVHMRWVTL